VNKHQLQFWALRWKKKSKKDAGKDARRGKNLGRKGKESAAEN